MQEGRRAIGYDPHVPSNLDIFPEAYFRTARLFVFKNLGKVSSSLLSIAIVLKVLINRRRTFMHGNFDVLFERADDFISLIDIITLTIDITELAESCAAEVGGILQCGTQRPRPDRVTRSNGLVVFVIVAHQIEGEE